MQNYKNDGLQTLEPTIFLALSPRATSMTILNLFNKAPLSHYSQKFFFTERTEARLLSYHGLVMNSTTFITIYQQSTVLTKKCKLTNSQKN